MERITEVIARLEKLAQAKNAEWLGAVNIKAIREAVQLLKEYDRKKAEDKEEPDYTSVYLSGYYDAKRLYERK